jgi:hypothetical protein
VYTSFGLSVPSGTNPTPFIGWEVGFYVLRLNLFLRDASLLTSHPAGGGLDNIPLALKPAVSVFATAHTKILPLPLFLRLRVNPLQCFILRTLGLVRLLVLGFGLLLSLTLTLFLGNAVVGILRFGQVSGGVSLLLRFERLGAELG